MPAPKHEYYIFDEAIVDERKVEDEARLFQLRGEDVGIHYHAGENKDDTPCNDRCYRLPVL